MKRLTFLTILLVILVASNVYVVSLTAEPTHPTALIDTCRISITPYAFYQIYGNGMSEAEFCKCFPCLCCECDGQWYVKRNFAPCPPNIRVSKICCNGTPLENTVYWWCCDLNGEPPCICCEPCNIDNCPPLILLQVMVVFNVVQLKIFKDLGVLIHICEK